MRAISNALKQKLHSNMQTRASDTDPRLSVIVARARDAVMDSEWWNVETIRVLEGIGDVAVAARRMDPRVRPDRFYEIHVRDGVARTTMRMNPDYHRAGWQHQFEIGPADLVSIEFNGEWKRHRRRWRFTSEESPWLFWVKGGALFTQRWDDETTKRELASGVTFIDTLRGWRNISIRGQDQGLIVAYVKNGKPFYRAFCEQADGSFAWEQEREVGFAGTALSVGLFIAHDYRLGYLIADNAGDVHWKMTPRNWAGMAIGEEKIVVSAKADVDFIPVRYRNAFETERITVSASAEVDFLFGATNNEIISAINIEADEDWGRYIEVEVRNPIDTPALVVSDVTLGTVIPVSIVSFENQRILQLRVSDDLEFGINPVTGEVNILFEGATNPAGFEYEPFEYSFTPINLNPPAIPLPEVVEVWNE